MYRKSNKDYKYILEAVIEALLPRFVEAKDEFNKEPNDFNAGRVEAFYEAVDVIKNRFYIYGYEPIEFGLDEKTVGV